MILNNIISVLKEAKNITIFSHISIDGDGLGSSLALGIALKKMGKNVTICFEEDIPYIYEFLPGKELVENCHSKIQNPDVAVAIDTGDLGRLGDRAEIFKSSRITINIDHHNTNSEFAFHNYVQTSSSATGEIIYQLIKMMGISIDAGISTCLYVAIATDTGGFRFSNTTSMTHQIVADLINNDVNISEISRKIFDTTSLEKVRLTGEAIKSIELLENGKIAFITITDEAMLNSGAKEEDLDGIVNIARNIKGVEVAALFRKKNNGVTKINLRSNVYVDVAAIASMFSGGGHKRAAGCTVEGNMDKIRETLLNDIREAL